MKAKQPEQVRFLGLDDVTSAAADVTLLPIPFEGTVSYGKGTAAAPAAVLRASHEIELWDEELDFNLDSLGYHTERPLAAVEGDTSGTYLARLFGRAQQFSEHAGLLIGIGGEHSITPSLVRGICQAKKVSLSALTVVHIDAHADLRSDYEGDKSSHVCALRPLLDSGARIISVGIRSAERDEFRHGADSGRVETFFAQQLAENPECERSLLDTLESLRGNVYLTIDVDALEVHLCPGTGTPQPGGLGWWQTLRYLRTLLSANREYHLVGCDIVETVPIPGTQVNEFVTAKLLAKVIAYRFCDVSS